MPIQIPNGPQIYSRDELINMGFVGYRGWSDPEAGMDFRAKNGDPKKGVEMAAGKSVPSFNFNYEEELKKAYGELGVYYDRILSESKGDVTKALSRLVDDYERGLRFSKEDTAQNLALADKRVQADALARGLYQESNFAPGGGMGIPDTNKQLAEQPILESQARGEELDLLQKTRRTEDINLEQQRYKQNLEQQRRKEAADLVNTRETRAYNRFASSLT
jgi:hypothetical protein